MEYASSSQPERDYFDMMVGADVFEKVGSVDSHHVMVRQDIAGNKHYVEQTCDIAEYFQELVAAREAMENQASPYDIWIDGVLCLGLDGDRITIGVQVGFVSADLAVDTSTGDYTVGLGVRFTDLTGTVDIGVGLKYDSKRGGCRWASACFG